MFSELWNDEAGAVVSGDLVLVMTFVVLGVLVGLVELQDSIVNELNDVGEAIGSLNQSFYAHGKSSFGFGQIRRPKSFSAGSVFIDRTDDCDLNECQITCDIPVPEFPKWGF